jgi:hypothetical protein
MYGCQIGTGCPILQFSMLQAAANKDPMYGCQIGTGCPILQFGMLQAAANAPVDRAHGRRCLAMAPQAPAALLQGEEAGWRRTGTWQQKNGPTDIHTDRQAGRAHRWTYIRRDGQVARQQ